MPDSIATNKPGVAFTPPPVEHIKPITDAITTAFATVSPTANGAVIGLVNEHGANAVLVARAGDNFKVVTWIGKSWGKENDLNYGAAVRYEF